MDRPTSSHGFRPRSAPAPGIPWCAGASAPYAYRAAPTLRCRPHEYSAAPPQCAPSYTSPRLPGQQARGMPPQRFAVRPTGRPRAASTLFGPYHKMAEISKGAQMTPAIATYVANLRISPGFMSIFKPNLDTSIGTSHKHRPGAILGREGVVRSRYRSNLYGGGLQAGLKNVKPHLVPQFSLQHAPEKQDGKAYDDALQKVRRAAKDDAMEFKAIEHRNGRGLNFEEFVNFIEHRVHGTHEQQLFDHCTDEELHDWFDQLDRDGDGHVSAAEFFALSLFESFEVAGYECGIETFIHLFPELNHGKISRSMLHHLLEKHGFVDQDATDELLHRAHKREDGMLHCDELLEWFKAIVRPDKIAARTRKHPVRDLIHILAHGHREHDTSAHEHHVKRSRDWYEKRQQIQADSNTEDAGSVAPSAADKKRLGYIVPSAADVKQAEMLKAGLLKEMSHEDKLRLSDRMREWDLNEDRKLELFEFYQALQLSGVKEATMAATQVVFDEIDADGDYHVTLDELDYWLHGKHEYQPQELGSMRRQVSLHLE